MKKARFLNKILCALLVAAFIPGMAACGKQAANVDENTKQEVQQSTANNGAATSEAESGTTQQSVYIGKPDPADLEWKQDTSPITLTAFINWPLASEWNWGKDDVSKEITRRTGVTIECTDSASDSTNQKLILMMTSGEKLPDFIFPLNNSTKAYSDMIKGDYLYPINELIDKYAPNMREVLLKGYEEFNADEKGNYYITAVQQFGVDQGNDKRYFVSPTFSARSDILEELGNPPLKTTDDLLNVLAMVKEKYPNMKYPIYMENFAGTAHPLFSSFGGKIHNNNYLNYYDHSRKNVYWWFEDEKGKSALRFCNELYRKGFVNEEIFTWSNESLMEQLNKGEVFMWGKQNTWETISANAKVKEVNPKANYSIIDPITAPGQVFEIDRNVFPVPYIGAAITKDSVNPERAIKFLEFLHTDEGNKLVFYGIEGQHYEMKKDGDVYYPEFIGDLSGAFDTAKLQKYGIYNYQQYFWTWPALYDYTALYDSSIIKASPGEKDIRDRMISNTYSQRYWGLTQGVTIDANLDESYINKKMQEFVKTQAAKIILSKTDEAFETEYGNLTEGMKTIGIDKVRAYMLQGVNKLLDKLEKANIQYTE